MQDTLILQDKDLYQLKDYNIQKEKFMLAPTMALGSKLKNSGCDFSKPVQILTTPDTGETYIKFYVLPHFDSSDMD